MEALLQCLQDLHPEIDFETCDYLMDEDILDTDDIEVLRNMAVRVYDVQIPEDEVTPENFNSAETIYDLIERLQEEG